MKTLARVILLVPAIQKKPPAVSLREKFSNSVRNDFDVAFGPFVPAYLSTPCKSTNWREEVN
jgi:hypothetical protein